jgi:hypothetical protein
LTVRLYLTAEGDTEERFAAQLLGPHLANFGVYLAGTRLTALCKKKGRFHRGGMGHYLPAKSDICRWLKQDRNQDARFTTMIDLYGLPRDFPAYEEASRQTDPYARVQSLEQAFANDMGDPRFIPYIQLHEFESLLFSDPAAFRHFYPQCDRGVRCLEQLATEFGNPELIDDGESTAPSKRIREHIPEYGPRAKWTTGPLIAERITLDSIRANCRHFNDWLTKLERLGSKQ